MRPGPAGQTYYQLTHDYLVHSLRDWLTRKQRETRRGRAELRLAERAALWNAKPETAALALRPGMGEHPAADTSKGWTEPQRRMMKRAGRLHGQALGLAVLVALAAWGGIEDTGACEHRPWSVVEDRHDGRTADRAATFELSPVGQPSAQAMLADPPHRAAITFTRVWPCSRSTPLRSNTSCLVCWPPRPPNCPSS